MLVRSLFAMFAIVLCSQAAHAQGSSEATSSSWTDNLYVNYFGIFHGPRINKVDQPFTLNHDGSTPLKAGPDGNGDMNFDSELTTAWMIDRDYGIGLTTQFYAYPVQGYGITMGDYGLKMFNKHLVQTNNLRVYANLNIQLPAGYDDTRGVDVKFKSTPYFRYDFTGSRFSVGSWSEIAYYAGAKAGNQYKFYIQPYVLYQTAPKFAWTLAYEIETDHTATPRKGSYFQTSETDFMPGFTYTFSKKFIVNPFLQIFTASGQPIALNRTGCGANISASL